MLRFGVCVLLPSLEQQVARSPPSLGTKLARRLIAAYCPSLPGLLDACTRKNAQPLAGRRLDVG